MFVSLCSRGEEGAKRSVKRTTTTTTTYLVGEKWALIAVPTLAPPLFGSSSFFAHVCNFSLKVFMWVPTLQGVVPGGVLPTGLVFSSFMVCIAIGGVLCSIMLRVVSFGRISVLSHTTGVRYETRTGDWEHVCQYTPHRFASICHNIYKPDRQPCRYSQTPDVVEMLGVVFYFQNYVVLFSLRSRTELCA